MRRSLTVTLLALTLAIPSTAKADPQTFNFDYYCIMGSFQVCASVRLTSATTAVLDPVSGKMSYVLQMDVWNLNGTMGGTHTMTAIGLYHAGYDFDWSGKTNSYRVDYSGTDITNYWTPQGAQQLSNLGGIKLELKEGTTGNAGITGCTDPGGSNTKWATCWQGGSSFPGQPFVRFTFNLSQQFSLNDVELRWHSQQVGPGAEYSLKCDTGGAGDYPDCVPNTAVPEPATLVLLGTGMAGLAGVARRRRRKALQS